MTLKYPLDLPSDYYFSIGFMDYKRPDPFSSLLTLTPTTGAENICLPIPGNMVDTQNLNWTQGTSIIGEAATDVWQQNNDGARAALTELVTKLPKIASETMGEVIGGPGLANMFGAGADAATKTALQKAGLALNPVLTQQFNNPEFKNHQFTWKFSPDSPEESAVLSEILKILRYQSLPGVSGGGAFFTYPSIANIKIHAGDGELYRFQQCVVKDISVNYAPNGVPSFFAGTQTFSSCQLTLSFIEIILNTRLNTRSDAETAAISLALNPFTSSITSLQSAATKVLSGF